MGKVTAGKCVGFSFSYKPCKFEHFPKHELSFIYGKIDELLPIINKYTRASCHLTVPQKMRSTETVFRILKREEEQGRLNSKLTQPHLINMALIITSSKTEGECPDLLMNFFCTYFCWINSFLTSLLDSNNIHYQISNTPSELS